MSTITLPSTHAYYQDLEENFEINVSNLYNNALIENAEKIDKLRLENYLKGVQYDQLKVSLDCYVKKIYNHNIKQSLQQLNIFENHITSFINQSSLEINKQNQQINYIKIIITHLKTRYLLEENREILKTTRELRAVLRETIN